GTTCGYWAIGRPTAASAPTRIISSAMTVEKTGRSMKKLNMVRSWMIYASWPASRIVAGNTPGPALLFRRCRRRIGNGVASDRCRHDRLHGDAGSQLTDAFYHYAVPRGQ